MEKNPEFFQNFTMISLAKKRKKRKWSNPPLLIKMADNDLKICQNNLLPNPFHMVDAKFDLVLKPISRGNLSMPFIYQFKKIFKTYLLR